MEKLVRKKVHRKKGSHGVGESRDGLLKINGKEQIFGDKSKIMSSPDEKLYVWRKVGEGSRGDIFESYFYCVR